MNLVLIFLSAVLVLNCLFLVLLVLIQLPKKEAGAGVAFGASATDALFGAGKGNALTAATKYAGTVFVALAVVMSVLYSNKSTESQRLLEQEIQKQSSPVPAAPLPATNQLAPVTPPSAASNLLTVPTNETAPAPAATEGAPNTETPAQTTATPDGNAAPENPQPNLPQ